MWDSHEDRLLAIFVRRGLGIVTLALSIPCHLQLCKRCYPTYGNPAVEYRYSVPSVSCQEIARLVD